MHMHTYTVCGPQTHTSNLGTRWTQTNCLDIFAYSIHEVYAHSHAWTLLYVIRIQPVDKV